MAFLIENIELPINVTPYGIAIAINNFLLSKGPISIQEIKLYRKPYSGVTNTNVIINYRDPGETNYFANIFFGDANQTADAKIAQLTTFFSTLRSWHIVDVSPEAQRNLIQDAVCVLFSNSYEADSTPLGSRPRIVLPVADIAAGAFGDCYLSTGLGFIGGGSLVSVKNCSPFTWPAQEAGWASLNLLDSTWEGFPSCCNVP